MSNVKSKLSSRLIAAFLSVVMVIGMIPISAMPALAATDEHPDAVTITVTDENGTAIEGATVAYTVHSDENGDTSGSSTTDSNGCVEVLSKDQYEEGLTLSATVSMQDYTYASGSGDIENAEITSDDQDFSVSLISETSTTGTPITDVTISAKTGLVYNGKPQTLVSINDARIGDTVIFQIVDDNEEVQYAQYTVGTDEPIGIEGTNARIYAVSVTVRRPGCNDLVWNGAVEIQCATITDIDITPIAGLSYDGSKQQLVTLTGEFQDTDKVTWTIGGYPPEEASEAGYDAKTFIPTGMAVSKYMVKLTVERENYKLFEKEVEASIGLGTIDLGNLEVNGLESVYNGAPQPAISVQNQGDYTLEFQLGPKNDDDFTATDGNWTKWTDKMSATVSDAGSYIIWVRATRDDGNYESSVEVGPAESAVFPFNIYIAKADQNLKFSYDGKNELCLTGKVPYKLTYDFSAIDEEKLANGTISYAVELSEENIASIDSDGQLTVNYPGKITIIATLTGDENYNECIISYELTVRGKANKNDYISFEESEITYILGTSDKDIISNQKVYKEDERIQGEISYTVDNVPKGVSQENEVLTVTDYNSLADEIRKANGELKITVTAKKFASDSEIYGEDEATYIVTIKFADTPDSPYSIPDPDGKEDWYITAPLVTPATGYTIARTSDPNDFLSNIPLNDQGTETRYVSLRDTSTGGITDRIAIDVKIDTLKPDVETMSIEFEELTLIEKIGKFFGFYNPSVTINFTVADETESDESGVDHITWTYTKDDDATSSITDTTSHNLPVTLEDGKYVATLTLTADDAEQYRGKISFTATDVAGNESETKYDDYADEGTIIVVDTINPTMSAAHELVDQTNGIYNLVGNQHYYNGDVKFTFTIKEANFFDEDVAIKVTKDGVDYSDWVKVTWSVESTDDETHYGVFTLSEDGDYIVSLVYSDQSGNPADPIEYKSDIITIDTKDPKVSFSFDQSKQETTFTVVEHNFRPDDITATVDAKDRNGDTVNAYNLTAELHAAEWTQSGDEYTYTTANYVSGIYNITLEYKDLADRTGAFTGEEFIVDHDPPAAPVIEYSDPINSMPFNTVIGTVLRTLTLGFYNPDLPDADVKVTFTSYDKYSGVDYFTWSYTRQEGASESNVESYVEKLEVEEKADSSDKSEFTASITLPLKEAEQLRGSIAATATDTYGNTSDTVTDDGYILVVDTIKPTMDVSYSQEDRMVGTNAFYNGDATVTFSVTEANFFPEDVVVKVSKDGGTAFAVTPSWVDESADVHVGTLILGDGIQDSSDGNVASVGDGDYVITVEYTDRSTNEMNFYTSHVVTIDTIKPVIDVQYHNNNVINTLADSEGNTREYYDAVQTATVTVTEHNFNADDVQFSIIGKDVTGAEQNIDSLITKSAWSTSGDVHKITLTYSGDANYTFDVDYTDLATNKADDYLPDHFTVDTVAPTITSVTYSTSVLETVLSSVSFGFYNAKMTVTITATDDTTGVHRFDYSYLTAAGVSSVNAQLLDQAIEEGNITYSDGGRTATMSFEIPKMVLGNDNQFNGTIQFDVIDRSNNKVERSEAKRVVVDNISPTATVTYNDPVNSVDGVSYYDGSINGVITINEANFYSGDVVVMVSKNGGAAQVLPTAWTDPSVDVHIGSFTLTDDGDYVITVTYKDKSGNPMADYTSNQLTIDTEIVAPTIILKGLSAQGVTDAEIIGTEDDTIYAFKDAIVPYVSFSDQNYDDYDITLTQVQRISKRSWSKQDLSSYITVANKAGDGDISLFALDKAEAERKLDDGIYQLTVSMKDKADHSIESTVTFTVNRFGSVYKYSDALVSLITSGGAYATWEEGVFMIRSEDLQVGELTITEYNANRIVDGSLNIDITRDGRSVSDIQIDTPAGIGNGRENWFEYQYLISENNFTEDGTYRITISSEDEAKNTPESVPDNSIAENNDAIVDTILFRVDSTVPEITSITGLENRIINEQTVEVRYTVYDAIGLKSVTVYVNDTEVQTIDSFDDLNNYSGTFTINESSSEQTVRILVEDLAGNVTDSDRFGETDADGNMIVPMPAYSFNRAVTVSTNFFVRWYANQPLFWGSIGGVVVLAGAIWFFIAYKRKKKEKN